MSHGRGLPVHLQAFIDTLPFQYGLLLVSSALFCGLIFQLFRGLTV
jgi:hypothetical protein